MIGAEAKSRLLAEQQKPGLNPAPSPQAGGLVGPPANGKTSANASPVMTPSNANTSPVLTPSNTNTSPVLTPSNANTSPVLSPSNANGFGLSGKSNLNPNPNPLPNGNANAFGANQNTNAAPSGNVANPLTANVAQTAGATTQPNAAATKATIPQNAPNPSMAGQCSADKTYTEVTLKGGINAGTYKDVGEVAGAAECARRCCDYSACDVALTLQNRCYLVGCSEGKSCKFQKAKPSAYHPTLTYVSRWNGEGVKHSRECARASGI